MNMLKQFIKQWYWWVNTVLYKSMGKVSLRMFDWWLTTQWFSHIWLWICLNWNNLLLSLLPYCWSLHWLKRLVQHVERELLTIPESTSSVWRASFIFFFPYVCWLLFAFVSFPIVCWPLPFYIGFWFFICYFLFVSKHTICSFSLKHTSVEVALNSPPLCEAIDRYWRCINDSLSSTSHLILMVFLNTTELSLIDPKFLDK